MGSNKRQRSQPAHEMHGHTVEQRPGITHSSRIRTPDFHGRLSLCCLLLTTLLVTSACSSSSDQNDNGSSDDQPGSRIDTLNYETVLELVFDVANAQRFRPLTDTIETVYGDQPVGIPDEQEFLSEVSATYDPDDFVMRYEYACSEGGSYRFVDPGSALGGGGGEFDECRFHASEHTGSFSRDNTLVKYVYSPGWITGTSYTGYRQSSLIDADSSAIDGRFDRFDGENENTEYWNITRLNVQSGNASTLISDALIQWYAGDQTQNPDDTAPWKRTFSAGFTLSSPLSGGTAMTVSTEEVFATNDRSGTYSTGILRVVGSDGSEMRVVADNGDPDSFQVDISSNGSQSSFTHTWEGNLRLRCLADPTETDLVIDSCR